MIGVGLMQGIVKFTGEPITRRRIRQRRRVMRIDPQRSSGTGPIARTLFDSEFLDQFDDGLVDDAVVDDFG